MLWPSAEYIISCIVVGSMYGGIHSIRERIDLPDNE